MASPTGLSQLGDALLRGSGDYANIQLRRQAEERARAQQLADLQDQRRYSEGQRDIQRGMALEDTTISVLIKEGWLKPTEARDPLAVQAAADRRQVEVDKQQAREADLPAKLQGEADYYGKQDAALAAEVARVTAKLNEPQPGPPAATDAAVQNLAKELAGSSDLKAIQQQVPAAQEMLYKQSYIEWKMGVDEAKAQIPLLRSQQTALHQVLGPLLQRGFVPNRPPPPAATLTPGAGAPSADPLAGFRAEIEKKRQAAAAATPPATPSNFGGAMGLVEPGSVLREVASNPAAALEVGGRAALGVPASILNFAAGGESRVAQGNAEREAEMAGALRAFNAPAAPLPANPFWQGNFMPALPPLKPLQPRPPALQFAPGY